MTDVIISPKTSPKDFFLNLGAIFALYLSVVSLLSLVFTTINKYYPDPISYGYDANLTTVRLTISSLIILYPIYLVLLRLIHRDISNFPEKRNLRIRKWSSYLTLFLTGATIACDLIILINKFLGGEISTRFVFKVLAVLAVALIVFWYYLLELKEINQEVQNRSKIISWVLALIVIASIIGGFIAAGSPFNERLRKFDERRIQDLSNLQMQIVNYWQRKGELPQTLNNLNDPLSSYTTPNDPQTNNSYEYQVKNSNTFELCATFSLPSDNQTQKGGYSEPVPLSGYINNNFKHGSGRTCFERNIDPALYPPFQTPPVQKNI